MAPPIRARPRFSHNQSLSSVSFHKPFILLHQRAGRMETTITENEPNWSHGSQPCLTQWNYEPRHVGPPKTDRSWWRVLTEHGPLEKVMANHFSILAMRTPWTVWKGKKIGQWRYSVWCCNGGYMSLYISQNPKPNVNYKLWNYRKLFKLITWSQPCLIQWNYEPCHVGPPKTDGSWWRVLTKCGPLEKVMANHFSILALRTPWTEWKGKKIWHWKMNSPGL